MELRKELHWKVQVARLEDLGLKDHGHDGFWDLIP